MPQTGLANNEILLTRVPWLFTFQATTGGFSHVLVYLGGRPCLLLGSVARAMMSQQATLLVV